MKLTQRLAIGYIQTKFKVLALLSEKKAAEQLFQLFCTPYERSSKSPQLPHTEPLSLNIKGLAIQGYRWNHPQTKKALLLHGFGSAAHKFEKFVSPLMEKGYEIMAFDAPAHGKSEGKTTNAIEYSNMIREVNNLYGPFDFYLAHSFGGLAVTLALEGTTPAIKPKMVLIAPATETTTAVDHAFNMLKLKNEAVRRKLDQLIYDVGGQQTAWHSVRRAIKNLNAEVLWIHDENDDVTPLADALKVKADNHSHINFVITKGLGHRRIYHDAKVNEQIVAFM